MSILNRPSLPRRGFFDRLRLSRRRRANLRCEILESRQLLSADALTSALSQIAAQPSVQFSPLASQGPTGYSPLQIQTAYGLSNGSAYNNNIGFGTGNGNGAGETIAIVDAYNDPNITSDLTQFSEQYGLPTPTASSFVVDNLGSSRTNAGWALEESLDVEWAHAIAPQANIVLVEAQNSNLASLFGAVRSASELKGVSVVSMSWGTPEFWGESNYDSVFTTPSGHNGVAFVASSGDSGAWWGPMYPSVSPNVLAVGGTTLTLGAGGTYGSETGWSYSTGGFSGTDSWFRFYETAPSYQVAAQQASGLNYGLRTTPDVAFNADPNTGVAVYDSIAYSGQKGWFQVGGTSLGAPSWAGLIAIADQGLATANVGSLTSTQLLTDLYNLPSSDFHEITSGFNGYYATPGYNLVTGLGTPNASSVVAGLLSAGGVSESARTVKSPTVVTTTTSGSMHRFDLGLSSTSGGNGSSSGSGSSAGGSLLTGPATGNAAIGSSGTGQLAALPPAQSVISQTTDSSAHQLQQQTTTSASLIVSAASTSTTTLGQGDQEPFVPSNWATNEEAPDAWLLVPAESGQPAAPDARGQRRQDPAPEPDLINWPCLPGEAGDPTVDPGAFYLDVSLGQMRGEHVIKSGDRPAPAGSQGDRIGDAQSPPGVSVLFAAAVLLTGGYRLAPHQPGRRRRQWLPGRDPQA